MRENIIKAIKNTFGLEEADDIKSLLLVAEVPGIRGLSDLINYAADPKTPPKIVRTALEDVVVNIKLKDDKTAREAAFLEQVAEFVDKPLHDEEVATHHSTSRFGM